MDEVNITGNGVPFAGGDSVSEPEKPTNTGTKEEEAQAIRDEFIARKQKVREITISVEKDIKENCPLLQCVQCNCEFDGEVHDPCPSCGSKATLTHVLRKSARL